MKARNYIGHCNIFMTVVNRFCDFCHTRRETHLERRNQ